MEELTVAIIGLGLMGGSLGLELANWPYKKLVKGYDINPKVAEKAKDLGAVDFISSSLEEVVKEADVVFLALPVMSTPSVFEEIRPYLSPSARVLDLGSTREWVWRKISPALCGLEYFGFHPMGGGEKSGIEHAQRGILRNVPILVSPPPISVSGKNIVEEIAHFLGGQVFF
ncbi:MAG TPA: prephenate dehydrogenase/arogenate dehydrogenase family protein [Candidatus Atribacteria bacterium]|nr:prephenate dehydrogenase/arogenate dehydrogenase family protein [Candidatus Atribacteria bacterium]HQE25409.1 prephenate dehydrogenase/arogenate dehydrogenase family protein [Candidatus Atribacteria bacterium]